MGGREGREVRRRGGGASRPGGPAPLAPPRCEAEAGEGTDGRTRLPEAAGSCLTVPVIRPFAPGGVLSGGGRAGARLQIFGLSPLVFGLVFFFVVCLVFFHFGGALLPLSGSKIVSALRGAANFARINSLITISVDSGYG